ncbi:MAG: hypothetical protein WDN76_03885 [Alphaproteobacteria bacterium]
MIIFLATHRYTHTHLAKGAPFDLQMRSYHWALKSLALPRATYIFSDFDRLGPWELELAARLYQQLKAAGMRVLNDPARALQRLSLLRRLYSAGFNSFQVWRVEDHEKPDRFPVFLRTQAAHRGVLTDLLETPEAAEAALQSALNEGYTRRDLMFVEYCAEPVKPDLFRKLAGFRIGDKMIPALCVHEAKWTAKYGSIGIAGAALYEDEADIIKTNRYGEQLRAAFDLADIEYGRADFGMARGKMQIYEINTNPDVRTIGEHPFQIRMDAEKHFFQMIREGLEAIDTPNGGRAVTPEGLIFRRSANTNGR